MEVFLLYYHMLFVKHSDWTDICGIGTIFDPFFFQQNYCFIFHLFCLGFTGIENMKRGCNQRGLEELEPPHLLPPVRSPTPPLNPLPMKWHFVQGSVESHHFESQPASLFLKSLAVPLTWNPCRDTLQCFKATSVFS